MVFLKEFFEKVDMKQNSRRQTNMQMYIACNELIPTFFSIISSFIVKWFVEISQTRIFQLKIVKTDSLEPIDNFFKDFGTKCNKFKMKR